MKCQYADTCQADPCRHRGEHDRRVDCAAYCCIAGREAHCVCANEGTLPIDPVKDKVDTPLDQQLGLVITCLEAINDSLRNEALNVALRKLKEINIHASYN